MTLSLSLKTSKDSYAPGEAVEVQANYTDPSTTAMVTVTGTATDPAGNVATATTSYTVVPPATVPVADVAATDNRGGVYTLKSNTGGIAMLTGTAPSVPQVVSGYGGAEPALAVAGNDAISWQGYTWEKEDWGTGPGQPKASNVTVSPSAQILTLSTAEVNGVYAGAEIDSARGDQGIPGNQSTWGYGTYDWVISKDLTTLPVGLCLGLFTYWASSNKGGPPGNCEIDVEFYSAGTIAGAPAFVQFGYYDDTGAAVTQGVPAGHVLLPGSQFALPAGLANLVASFTWLPGSITWNLWAGTDKSSDPIATATATQGQVYSYTQLYGGNQFAGTVSIPKTGKQQLLTNLWTPNGTAPPGDPAVSVPISAFTYTEA